ncbi:MAG: alpha/beta hydrolase, partial [Odoribacter sp.]|nr:alpha/beta hydrolase [Odoribacter sp.]
LDTLGIENVIVLGHSMGGILATRFTLMFSDRVKKFVLEDWKIYIPYCSVEELYKGKLSQNYEKIKNYQFTYYYHGEWKPEYKEWTKFLPDGRII